MQRSLFARYFTICAAIILFSITVLGVVLLALASNYFTQDKYDTLTRNVEFAATLTASDYKSNNYSFVTQSVLMTGYKILAKATDADVFLVDNTGKTLLCTQQEPCVHNTYTISQDILNQTARGKFVEIGNLGGIYKESYYTVGVPVVIDNGTIIGMVYASISAGVLDSFLIAFLKMFILSAIVVLLIACIIIYFVSESMVRPLKQMSKAAQSFSKGDFSARIHVERYDEIGRLSIAFNKMAKELGELEVMRRSFIANVSHELRTPMTTIAGFIDGILDGTIPPEKQPEYLQTVSQEVKRLSRLVRGMLDSSRIEDGKITLNKSIFDIHDVTCQTVFSFESKIEEKNIEIRGLDTDKMMIEADLDMIHQVIYNLVENAVKFTDVGGYIQFSFKEENGFLFVSIKNSGDGIAEEELPKVFERFYKSDKSRGIDKSGVGLGLFIVKSIITAHGGDILARSVEGEFCEFIFKLPALSKAKMKRNEKIEKNEK